LVPWIPIISIISCMFLITQLSSTTLQRFAISIIIGVSVYFVYGMRNSKLHKSDDSEQDDIKLITDNTLIETKIE
jgi:basic amino acid/polyamine antiporter, APA family